MVGALSLFFFIISTSGVGELVKTDGTINREMYCKILINHMIPSGKIVIGSGFIFEHDIDPKLTVNAVKTHLNRKTHNAALSVIDYAFQSLYLNYTEAVWDRLDGEQNKRQPTTKEELWMSFKKALENYS